MTLAGSSCKRLLLAGILSLGWQASARAQLVITSSNPNIFTVARGQTISLSATVRNMFANSLYLLGDNADFFTAAGPTEVGAPTSNLTVALNDSPFSGTPTAPAFPAPLTANEQRTIALANIFVGTNATTGVYNGYFTLQGNTDPNGAANDLVTQNFQITVTAAPVPEASTLLSLGLLTLGAWKFRRPRFKPSA